VQLVKPAKVTLLLASERGKNINNGGKEQINHIHGKLCPNKGMRKVQIAI